MTKISLSGLASSLLIMTLLAAPLRGRAQEDEKKTPLAQQMSGIAKDFRALRKMINDPSQKDAAVKLVKDMEDRATKSKDLEPAKTKTIPPADKDQFLLDYRKQLDGLIADMQKLETAVSAGNSADASALMDTIQGDKRDGHKKFNAEAGGGPGGTGAHQPNWPSPAPAQTGT